MYVYTCPFVGWKDYFPLESFSIPKQYKIHTKVVAYSCTIELIEKIKQLHTKPFTLNMHSGE